MGLRFELGKLTMVILAVDTSSRAGSLALLRDTSVLEQKVITSEEPYSASLLRDAQGMLARARMSFEEVDLFAVDAGPGSFTGLRVGLTTVKGWAEVWRRPVAAVSGLEAMAIQVPERHAPESFIAAVMDAGRGELFGALFRTRGDEVGEIERIGEEVVSSPKEFLESLQLHLNEGADLAVACISPETIKPAMERVGFGCCRIEAVSNVLAPFIGRLGYARAMRHELVDALHLDANYIRRSDAEMNWKGG